MAKAASKKKAAPKKRASTYEAPVKFNGSFEDMIAISTTGAGAKNKKFPMQYLSKSLHSKWINDKMANQASQIYGSPASASDKIYILQVNKWVEDFPAILASPNAESLPVFFAIVKLTYDKLDLDINSILLSPEENSAFEKDHDNGGNRAQQLLIIQLDRNLDFLNIVHVPKGNLK